MSDALAGNILALQTGRPTAVSNAILSGIVSEALNHDVIEEVLGALGGFSGLLREDLIDLAEESQQAIRGLRHTPGAALGSSALTLKSDQDIARALQVIQANNIRFVVISADLETLADAKALIDAAQVEGYALQVIVVPQSAENAIPSCDHCVGYGTAIKQIASTVKELSNELQTRVGFEHVSILEISGATSGWLVAGSTLTKTRNRPDDAPHVLCMPEVRFNPTAFLEEVQNTLKKQRHCLIVASGSLFDSDGNYLGNDPGSGIQIPIGDYLAGFIQEHLGLNADVHRFTPTRQLSGTCLSQTDNDEAFLCGAEAVKAAVSGQGGKRLGLLRGESEGYSVDVSLSPLSSEPLQPKSLPQDWIHDNGLSLRHQFHKYAIALIQGEVRLPYDNGLPLYAQLGRHRIDRKLEPLRQS